MAKKVTIEISDDTDGSRADQTVPFGLDGVSYEIDLSNANANALRSVLTPFVSAARRTGGRRLKVAVGQTTDRTENTPQTTDGYTAAHDIRSWARDHGYEVSSRGRIPTSVLDAYHSSPDADTSRRPATGQTRSEKRNVPNKLGRQRKGR
ncbi:Lsr2 family protein [Amycolatopsis sp. Hca4]|uniref:histone-like nucleoid-structuring protein Lsr2 n=1 Tax=Amycolatopsis sp. Hca4 TaxID=2742131 RepID=UPI00158FE2DA|nr:Lsr2 family protein [Amycolatopsis sp. Hca4]QKV80781.1 Lsr2 family protein [Amycolatopsis sp. Hca4]